MDQELRALTLVPGQAPIHRRRLVVHLYFLDLLASPRPQSLKTRMPSGLHLVFLVPQGLRSESDLSFCAAVPKQPLIAEKFLMSIKGKVEENCSKLSNTEGGKVGQSKVMALCGYLEETFWECNKKRIELATSVGTLGVDLKQPGAKETAKKCDVRFSLTRKNEVFQKNYMRIGVDKLLRMGLVSERVRGGQAVGIAHTERLKLRRKMAAAACKKKSVSLSLFMEVNSLEVEEGLSTMATLFCAKGVCGWEDGRERERERDRERAEDGVEEAGFRSAEMETSEMAWRSCDARNPCFGHQVAAVVHLDV